MKFLFVINTFYPETVAASALVINLSENLIKNGYEVDVLTLRKDETVSEYEVYNRISIYRIIDYNLLTRRHVKKTFKSNHNLFLKLKIATSYILAILYRTIQMKCSRDNIVAFRTKLYKKKLRKLIANKQYSSIVTVGGDLSGSVAATELKKENINFRFIFYQVDPYTNNYVYGNKNKIIRHKIEKEVFIHSDGIIMPSSNYLDVITNGFTVYDNKIKIVEFPKIQELKRKSTLEDVFLDKKFVNIIYTGMLYKDIRNPKYALELFSKLNMKNIRIYFVGCSIPIDSAPFINILKDNLFVIDRIPQQAVSNLLLDADLLINIGNSVINTFPSKVFEYFSSGKPIINFFKSPECPTLQYSKKYPEIIDVLEDYSQIADNIDKVQKFINKDHKIVEFCLIKKVFSECTVTEVSKQFESVLIDI